MLNDEQKKKIENYISKQEVDVRELDSYRNYGHPNQNFDRFAEPDDERWDEDEEYAKQCEMAIDCIKEDGVNEILGFPESLKDEVIEYIESKKE